MVSSNEVINLINSFSLTERLIIVEEILRNIREEDLTNKSISQSKDVDPESAILNLAGVINEEEAKVLNSAVEESRKIDGDKVIQLHAN